MPSSTQLAMIEAQGYDYQAQVFATDAALAWTVAGKPNLTGVFDLTLYKSPIEEPALNAQTVLGKPVYLEPPGLPTGWTSSGDDITPAEGWTNVTDLAASVDFMQRRNENMVAWTATVKGSDFNYALDREHLVAVVVKTRYIDSTGVWTAWSSWRLWWVGFISEVSIDENSTNSAPFSATVQGLSYLLRIFQSPAQSLGITNLALGKDVTTSSVLLDPAQQAYKGEFTGSTATVAGSNTVNGDVLGAPWIANDAPVKNRHVSINNGGPPYLLITEVFCWAPLGYPGEVYQWFEIYNRGNGDQKTWGFYNSSGQSIHPDGPNLGEGEYAIICYDAARFIEMFGQTEAAYIKQWKDVNPNFHLNPVQDYLMLETPYGLSQVRWSNNVSWRPTRADDEDGWFAQWDGDPVNSTLIAAGNSIERYGLTGDTYFLGYEDYTKDEWHTQSFPTPGRFRMPDKLQYISVDLGTNGILTTAETAAGATEIACNKTFGMPPLGNGFVDIYPFRYTGKTATTLTGVTWPRGQAPLVGVGATVQYAVSSWLIKEGFKIGGINLWRRAGLSHIKEARIFVSPYANPPYPDIGTPDDISWQVGWWTQIHDLDRPVADNGCIKVLFPDDQKYWARHVMVLIDEMSSAAHEATVTPDLAKLNEIEIYPAWTMGSDAKPGSEKGTSLDAILYKLLVEQFGLPLTKLGVSVRDVAVSNQSFTKASLWDILNELGRIYGVIFVETLDFSLFVAPNPWWWWAGSHPTSCVTFDRDNCLNFAVERTPAHVVGKIKVVATDPDRRASYVVSYPTECTYGPEVTETGYVVTGGSANAVNLGQALYRQRNYQVTGGLSVVGPMVAWLYPTLICSTDWVNQSQQVGEEVSPYNDITYLVRWEVTGVQSKLNFGDRRAPRLWQNSVNLMRFRG